MVVKWNTRMPEKFEWKVYPRNGTLGCTIKVPNDLMGEIQGEEFKITVEVVKK